mmetsp:Transcript_17718/g.41831  ORF Transcript_17718/g.41831 Transcript_17718/m.41831 type:complete len:207 (+) Transcript_17718:663-1283(+)
MLPPTLMAIWGRTTSAPMGAAIPMASILSPWRHTWRNTRPTKKSYPKCTANIVHSAFISNNTFTITIVTSRPMVKRIVIWELMITTRWTTMPPRLPSTPIKTERRSTPASTTMPAKPISMFATRRGAMRMTMAVSRIRKPRRRTHMLSFSDVSTGVVVATTITAMRTTTTAFTLVHSALRMGTLLNLASSAMNTVLLPCKARPFRK